MAAKDLRVNKEIRVREVRLIDEKGEQRGIIPTIEALELAHHANADLVEVSPNADPPVCKILDYGKYKFDQEKRRKESKKKQKQIKLKEIRMQPKIETHDLEFKTKHIKTFLEEGNKVKVTIRFRGRELAHTELGRDVLMKVNEILEELETDFSMDRKPIMEGRFMSMILSPKTGKK
ncbi:translation initiation factor IF-3 [Sediminispirochaeta bajacaliforniensis]|uniref:translation initiation factor IF-3 n=1 Tax=Sediminispirochaeta bajacaliforniensis TaxID=148 RepID=UPI000381B2E2|nr:translation initiation factor IF-3 [Sediminispirochaeta bajacaliforniensis]